MRVTQYLHQYMTLYCAKLKPGDQPTALASRPVILQKDLSHPGKQSLVQLLMKVLEHGQMGSCSVCMGCYKL